jgi:hypothetical protein
MQQFTGLIGLMPKSDEEQYDEKEAQRRLRKTLHGAFSGPPMPLKDIPTRDGESRKIRRVISADSASSASAKNVSRRKKDRA